MNVTKVQQTQNHASRCRSFFVFHMLLPGLLMLLLAAVGAPGKAASKNKAAATAASTSKKQWNRTVSWTWLWHERDATLRGVPLAISRFKVLPERRNRKRCDTAVGGTVSTCTTLMLDRQSRAPLLESMLFEVTFATDSLSLCVTIDHLLLAFRRLHSGPAIEHVPQQAQRASNISRITYF